ASDASKSDETREQEHHREGARHLPSQLGALAQERGADHEDDSGGHEKAAIEVVEAFDLFDDVSSASQSIDDTKRADGVWFVADLEVLTPAGDGELHERGAIEHRTNHGRWSRAIRPRGLRNHASRGGTNADNMNRNLHGARVGNRVRHGAAPRLTIRDHQEGFRVSILSEHLFVLLHEPQAPANTFFDVGIPRGRVLEPE